MVRVEKFHHGGALTFAAIYKWPFPVSHYHGIVEFRVPLEWSKQYGGWSSSSLWSGSHRSHASDVLCGVVLCWRLAPHWQVICLGDWNNIWEVIYSTKMRNWGWLFVGGCDCKSPVCTTLEFSNLCQCETNASLCWQVVLKNNEAVVE